jgi:MFS transporter, UMF1 family
MAIVKNNPKIMRAWCFYDWANSVYSLVIISTIFPIYYGAIAVNDLGEEVVHFLGYEVKSSALFAFSVSSSFMAIAIMSPFLTAIADYSGRKKLFMQIFCYIGAVSCSLLFFFTRETLTQSVFLFILASIGFSGSIVFYNSYLPEIATEDRYDKLSARGFALGYIGSVVLLIANLILIMKPVWFGIDPANTSLGPRISFLSTGIWWFGFAQYTFYYLPRNVHRKKPRGSWILNGFRELGKVLRQVKGLYLLKRFLLAFFFYNMGVQTVMYVAVIFADQELRMESESLILTVLILQLVAIGGAYGFASLSARFGNIKALTMGVTIWIGICVWAYFVSAGLDFYALAALIGMVMGGIQSLSRSTYSKLIPSDTTDTASYFSFYDITEKVSIVIGTLAYGYIDQLTGSMRNSILVLMVFFFVGLIFLARIKGKKNLESAYGSKAAVQV